MTKMTATKQELVNLINGLFAVQEVQGKQFSLTVSKNIQLLKEELKDLEKAATPSEEFLKLASKVNEITKNTEVDSEELIEKLEEENKELVEARRAQMEAVQLMMEDELEVNIHTISEDIIPEDMTAKQINNIIKILV